MGTTGLGQLGGLCWFHMSDGKGGPAGSQALPLMRLHASLCPLALGCPRVFCQQEEAGGRGQQHDPAPWVRSHLSLLS